MMRGGIALVAVAGCARSAAPPVAPVPSVTQNRVEAVAEPAGVSAEAMPSLALRPLAERCAIAKLLALQTVDALAWRKDLPDFVDGNRAYLVVFVDDDNNRMLRDGETCPVVPIRGSAVEVVSVGTEVNTSAWYLSFWLRQDTAAPGTYRFEWPRNRFYRGSAPAPPGQPSIGAQTMTSSAAAPRLVFEFSIRDGTVTAERAEFSLMKRRVNLQ